MSDELTVFIVDDDCAAASSVEALMTSVGLNVETYNSAEEFLAAFDGSRKGCLVLDVRLRGMSGLELQEVLAAENLEIPIVVISGHADLELNSRALKKGAVACLEKPFNGNVLLEIVRDTLSQGSSQNAKGRP